MILTLLTKQTHQSYRGSFCVTKTCPCNIQRFLKCVKNENIQQTICNFFLIFAQNTDCGCTLEPPQRGGFNEYTHSLFWSKNKKHRYTSANTSSFCIRWGSSGYTFHGHVFLMDYYHCKVVPLYIRIITPLKVYHCVLGL